MLTFDQLWRLSWFLGKHFTRLFTNFLFSLPNIMFNSRFVVFAIGMWSCKKVTSSTPKDIFLEYWACSALPWFSLPFHRVYERGRVGLSFELKPISLHCIVTHRNKVFILTEIHCWWHHQEICDVEWSLLYSCLFIHTFIFWETQQDIEWATPCRRWKWLVES